MNTFPSKPLTPSSAQPASTPTSTKTETGSNRLASISSSPVQPRPSPGQNRSNSRTSSKRRMKFRNAAPNLAPRVLAGAELLLVNKIAFAAAQLLPAVPVLTATVDLQKKAQVNEYKGESKFLTATKRGFCARRADRRFRPWRGSRLSAYLYARVSPCARYPVLLPHRLCSLTLLRRN
jgi:hypothetical protein